MSGLALFLLYIVIPSYTFLRGLHLIIGGRRRGRLMGFGILGAFSGGVLFAIFYTILTAVVDFPPRGRMEGEGMLFVFFPTLVGFGWLTGIGLTHKQTTGDDNEGRIHSYN